MKFLLHSVEIQKSVRNQVVCKEGELLQHVYFVKSGEFKMLRNQLTEENKDDQNIAELLRKQKLRKETKVAGENNV